MASGRAGGAAADRQRDFGLHARLAGIRWRIPLLYLLIGIGWILSSDRLIAALFAADVQRLQTAKGVLFVLVTAGALALLLRRQADGIGRAHRRLLAAERRYRTLLDTLPDPTWLQDADDGRLLYANPAARAFFGLGEQDTGSAGIPFGRRADAADGAGPSTGMHRLRHGDGSLRDVEVRVNLVEYGDRQARLVGMRDRTAETVAERRRAQAALRMREAQRTARLGSWELDPATGRGHVSEETRRMLGLPAAGEDEQDIRALMMQCLPDWQAQLARLFDAALSGESDGFDVVVPVPAPSGERRLHLRGRRVDGEAGRRLLHGTLQDVTEAEAARRQLREREQQFRELIRVLPDGVMLVAGGRVRYANPACAAAFGYEADAMTGLAADALVDDADAGLLREWLRRAHAPAAAAPAPPPAPRMRRRDGALFNAVLAATPARYEDGICTLLMVRDLTDAERMRDRLAAGNRELHAVASRIFSVQEDERRAISRDLHDEVGQSITAIRMSASAAMEEPDPARRRDDLEDILVLADSTLERLRNISILLRPPQLDALGLEAALRWHAERMFRTPGTAIRLEIDELPRRPTREVEQACFRIAQEALTNVARHAQADAVTLALRDADGRLALRVADDGRGFDPRAAGGLGLVIMRERAQAAGGTLSVASEPGAGTRIEALLPYGA